MADQNTDKPVQPSYLEMSDEEIMNSSFPAEVPAPAAEEKVDEADDEPADTQTAEDTEVADADDEDAGTAAEEDAAGADDKNEEEDPEAKAPESDSEKKPEKKAEESDKKPDEAAVDFEAEYKRLLAPFKANGRDIAVKSVDDAIALMQMGANYNKKMAALKPNLKLMKLLENNGLLSEDKIGFLIDLEKKNPAAINKLVKDSGIDPMDLDAEKASGYKQTAYTVDDREIELDTVLDEIQGSPSYNRTLEIVSTKWDAASKQVIAGNPQLLKVINGHVDSGIYDLISKEIESERLFGRLNGLSDIEAYRQVGDALHAKGAFNSLAQGSSQNQQKPATPPVVVTPKPKVEDDKLKDKRRAASSTKPAAPTSTPKDFNPLAMSDEEFNKLVNKQFL
jgi:hypothetical protein